MSKYSDANPKQFVNIHMPALDCWRGTLPPPPRTAETLGEHEFVFMSVIGIIKSSQELSW